jgi:hypothetical protein
VSLGDYDFNNDQKRPVPVPGVLDSPTYTISINEDWLPHIAGAIENLADEDVWLGTPTEREDAVSEIIKLLAAIAPYDDGT